MSKKLHISSLPDESSKILGINTEERIWKLSFELNRLLGLHLQRNEKDPSKPSNTSTFPTNTLFSLSDNTLQESEAEFLYRDDQSFAKYTVILCAGAGKSLPKLARPFRYFLILSYTTTDFQEQEWKSWIDTLQESPVVLTLCDFSHLQELKNMLS